MKNGFKKKIKKNNGRRCGLEIDQTVLGNARHRGNLRPVGSLFGVSVRATGTSTGTGGGSGTGRRNGTTVREKNGVPNLF